MAPTGIEVDEAPLEIRIPLEELIAGLGAEGALVEGERAEVVQTHISVVFLAGRRAWKVKKPMRLWGLLDYGTVEARRHWCEEEVRLNRRTAPDVYLGVVPITRRGDGLEIAGDGEVVEHAVEMVRLAKGVTLRERVAAGTVKAEELERVGRHLALFHGAHRLDATQGRNALPAAFADVVRRNLESTAAGVPDRFPASVHAGLRTRLARRVWRARELMRRRVREGRTVDGHGDVRLDHVVRHQGRIAIVDCCEFSAKLRHIDPLSDAAFLSMDLTVRGRPDLAEVYERAYLEHAGEMDGPPLLPLYRAYRAHVRAMVDERSCQSAEIDPQTRAGKALGAMRSMAMAVTEARTGAPQPLVVLRGPAGSGKSWVAERLAPWLGAVVVRSDVVRKELLGHDPTWRPSAEEKRRVYGADMHRRTYAAVLERARAAVESGHAALLDATYLRRRERDRVRAAAKESGVPFVILDVTCDPEIVATRLRERARREDDASDADQAVYEQMKKDAQPLGKAEAPFACTFESGRPEEEAVLPLLAVVEGQVDATTEPLGPGRRPGGDEA